MKLFKKKEEHPELDIKWVLNDVLELCRRELGNDYHMCIELYDYTIPEWTLYKRYDDPDKYFSPENKAILSSKKGNTIEELVKFTLCVKNGRENND